VPIICGTVKFENRFYVSEITNIPSSEMFIYIDTTECGKKLDFSTAEFKVKSPDRFYFHY